MNRIVEEKRTVEAMIRLYCRRKEGHAGLCSSCAELLDYARQVQNYRELVRRCFPGIEIECYLLFVRLMKEDDSHRKADPAEQFTPEYFDIIRVADSHVQSAATLTSLMSNIPITR